MLPTASHCVVLRLLEEIVFPFVAGEGAAGPLVEVLPCCSRLLQQPQLRLFSALRGPPVFFQQSICLRAATRFGFFAGRVVGVGEVTCSVMSPAGVSAAGVSGCCSVDIM